jgi:hypothetical protein
MKARPALIPIEAIQRQILLLRGQKVILDATLAAPLWRNDQSSPPGRAAQCPAVPC